MGMPFIQKITKYLNHHESSNTSVSASDSSANEKDVEQLHTTTRPVDESAADGVARVEALQAVWGKNGKYMLWAG